MRRTNTHGLLTLGIWLLLCIATGAIVGIARHTLWVWPAMLLYGGVLCFAYAASHECAHGTAFKSRWLNEAVFWFTSLVFIEEPLYRRYSHAEHHTHTWFNQRDPQKPYGNPLTLTRYLSGTFGLTFYLDAMRQLIRHSRGKFTPQELDFLPPLEDPPGYHQLAADDGLLCRAPGGRNRAFKARGPSFFISFPASWAAAWSRYTSILSTCAWRRTFTITAKPLVPSSAAGSNGSCTGTCTITSSIICIPRFLFTRFPS